MFTWLQGMKHLDLVLKKLTKNNQWSHIEPLIYSNYPTVSCIVVYVEDPSAFYSGNKINIFRLKIENCKLLIICGKCLTLLGAKSKIGHGYLKFICFLTLDWIWAIQRIGERRVIYIFSIINEGFPEVSVVSHSSVQSTVIDIRHILLISKGQ